MRRDVVDEAGDLLSGIAVQVGLFGLQTITSRVATVISARIAQVVACSASSGT